eukprot:Awhi_evm1s1306
MLVLWIVYDIFASFYAYTSPHVALKEIADVTLNLVMNTHSSCMFVLIAHFQIVANEKNKKKEQVTSSLEYKVLIIYS